MVSSPVSIDVVSFCCSVVEEGVDDCFCVVVTTAVGCCVAVTSVVGCSVAMASDVSCCVAVTSDVNSVHTDSAVDVDPVVVELWTSGDEALLVSVVIIDGFVDVSLSGISVPFSQRYGNFSLQSFFARKVVPSWPMLKAKQWKRDFPFT